MPIRLDTVLRNVERMSNSVNSGLLKDFYQHMKDNGTSQNYQKGNLKAMTDSLLPQNNRIKQQIQSDAQANNIPNSFVLII
jgi:hypothetical protein